MIPLLSVIVATLAIGTVATFLSGARARWVALATTVVFLVEVGLLFLAYPGWPGYNNALVPGFADGESYSWISLAWMHINYTVGVDGISLVLILLTAILQLATVVYSWEETKRPAAYFGLVLLTCLGCFGVFIALDVLLFFLFWEAVLVPMFFLIGYWGGPQRRVVRLLRDLRVRTRALGGRAVVPVPRAVLRVRREVPDRSVPHVASGRARRGPDGRIGPARGTPPEAGRLRADPLGGRAPSERPPHRPAGPLRRRVRVDHLGLGPLALAARHEAPGRVLLDQPHGDRAARDRPRFLARTARRGPPHVRPRDRERPSVHGVGQRAPYVRDAGYPGDWGNHPNNADPLDADHGRVARVAGPAGADQLPGGVRGAARDVERSRLLGVRAARDPGGHRRILHLDDAADAVRAGARGAVDRARRAVERGRRDGDPGRPDRTVRDPARPARERDHELADPRVPGDVGRWTSRRSPDRSSPRSSCSRACCSSSCSTFSACDGSRSPAPWGSPRPRSRFCSWSPTSASPRSRSSRASPPARSTRSRRAERRSTRSRRSGSSSRGSSCSPRSWSRSPR